jgi:peptide/nickel transport system substrate-binding protein
MTDDSKRHYGINRRQVLTGVGVTGVTALAGCTSGDGEADDTTTTTSDGNTDDTTTTQQMSGGTLKAGQAKSPVEFDPIVLNDVPSSEIVSTVVEGLYSYQDQSTDLQPQLAASQPEVSKEGKRWVVPIEESATFQNGDDVTAEDVKYSFEAPVKEETENATEVEMIDSITKVDEKTVQFDLKYPFGPFKTSLGWYVVPKSVREADQEAFNTGGALVGSGPFKFDEWSEGQFTRVTRWDDYWGDELPNVDTIEFVPVEEPTTRVTSLKTAENDLIKGIPPQSWDQVKGMDDASVSAKPSVSYFYLAFNCNDGPTADPQVREAIDYAFSMDQAVSNFVEPAGVRQYSPLPRSIANSWDMPLDEWKQIPHDKDIDKAKSMLDDADGVPSDWNANIIVPPDDKREQIGITVSNALKEAGYDATVQRLDWGAFLQKYNTGDPEDYNMFTLGWSGTPDPDAFTYYLFYDELANAENGTNGAYYVDDQVSEWIMTGRQSADRDERQEVYQKAITQILEDRAHLPAYGLKNSFGVKDYVSSFEAHGVLNFPLTSGGNNVSVNK